MATVSIYQGPNFTGGSTDTFFIPGRPEAMGYSPSFAGGGTQVTLTYAGLGLRFTYNGSGMTFSGLTPQAGLVHSITVSEFQGGSYHVIGTLTLPTKTYWSFANVFTASFANAYATKGHQITGSYDADTLIGGALADVISTNGDADLVYGNAGNDVLVVPAFGPATGTPVAVNLAAFMGDGVDTLRFNGSGGGLNLTTATLHSFERIEMDGANVLHLSGSQTAAMPAALEVVANGSTVQISQGAGQPISAAGMRVTGDLVISVVGTSGNDIQQGNNVSRDRLWGAGGHDSLRGFGGADTLIGDAGNDTLDGGAAIDHLVGGTGDDLYIVYTSDVVTEAAGGGQDMIRAYADHVMEAEVENLQVWASLGLAVSGNGMSNQMGGGAGNDTISAGAGDDTLTAGLGDDRIGGGSGDDLMNGQGGHDALSGGAGNDRLIGNIGNDTLTGGDGADSFLFRTGDGDDRIRDFSTNGDVDDVIDLRDLVAVTSWADLQANHMAQVGLNVVITAGADSLVLERVWCKRCPDHIVTA